MLTTEQQIMIQKHLRQPEKEQRIADIVRQIVQEDQKAGGNLDPNEAATLAFVMNIGEMHPSIGHIYSLNWKEHPEAITLNREHGALSVEMLREWKVALTTKQEQIIRGHSKGEYPNRLAQIIKVAEICSATEQERFFRGEKKSAAKSWEEVANFLKEEGIETGLIALVGNSYAEERFSQEKMSKDKQEQIR